MGTGALSQTALTSTSDAESIIIVDPGTYVVPLTVQPTSINPSFVVESSSGSVRVLPYCTLVSVTVVPPFSS